jgi:hypothetical protein
MDVGESYFLLSLSERLNRQVDDFVMWTLDPHESDSFAFFVFVFLFILKASRLITDEDFVRHA